MYQAGERITGAMANGQPLLETRQLTKRFPGTIALDGVDFQVQSGEVHALLGENGAGKSTLIKVLAGVHKADSGEVRVKDRVVDPMVDDLSASFIHQDLGLVDTMTVSENVAILAGYPRKNGLISWRKTELAAAAAIEQMGGGVNPGSLVSELSAAEKSIVAIARAIAIECDILVLDEPTAALPEADVERLLSVLRRLRETGIGIVYVSHRLDEVFRIADRVTVLRDGRLVRTVNVSDTSPKTLIQDIVGRTLSELFSKAPIKSKEALLSVSSLVIGDIGPVSFEVAFGEILGLVGLRGAGQDIVGRAIFGDLPTRSGHVSLTDSNYRIGKPNNAISSGIGFVSSKRAEESLARTLTVRENCYMNPISIGLGLFSPISPAEEQSRCAKALHRFSVRPPESERVITTLSGGNQQKVIIARWMESGSRLLILEEPTLGVDVGSKAEIYGLLQEQVSQGLAVLLISSDFEEIAGICHRALVFDRGTVRAELTSSELTIPTLIACASGTEEQQMVGLQ